MQGKVIVEEHFALPETLQDSAGFVPHEDWIDLKARLLDMQDHHLREMDQNGVEVARLRLHPARPRREHGAGGGPGGRDPRTLRRRTAGGGVHRLAGPGPRRAGPRAPHPGDRTCVT
jgi:hypothetical protein